MNLDIVWVSEVVGVWGETPDDEREGIMNEHENEARNQEQAQELHVLEPVETIAHQTEGDLVVDLSGIKELNLASLTLLLTAQQNAKQEDRAVWLAGVPLSVWRALDSMGLGKFFKPFPVSGEGDA